MKNNFSLKFKIFDVFILAFATIFIVSSIVATNLIYAKDNNKEKIVQIYYQNKLIINGEYSLNDIDDEKIIVLTKDEYPDLAGDMTIIINKEKGICISEAICPNHYCTKQGWINRVGYPIVCVPNGVYVIITASEVDEDLMVG